MKKKCQKDAVPSRRAVNFELRDIPGREVIISGTFNDWKLDRRMNDKNGDGTYRCRMLLAPGVYQYKFRIDGEWRVDPVNPNFQPNDFGSLNSVLKIENK